MRSSFFLCCALAFGIAGEACVPPVVAQPVLYDVQYRPSDARYRIGHYPHFDLIYQEGTEQTASRVASMLEANVVATDSLVGRRGSGQQMPVVVNGYNDRSNGMVSPLPFRQEIEAPSLKRDALTTYFSSWPAMVAPHELVHAAHADVNAGVGIGGLVRLGAPDWSRVINLTAPDGLIEGVAVYRESQLQPRAGRLNAPLATMVYRAAMLSDDPWSLTQMLEEPSYTRPFDRHYLGGGQAFAYLVARDGTRHAGFFRRATRFHHRFPFLGFGIALWRGVGLSPWTLGATMQRDMIERERARHEARSPFTSLTAISSAQGLVHRRPHWIDNSTLVVHLQGYNRRAGFYAVDANSGRRTLLSAQRIAEDYTTSLSRDTSALYFSRYVPDRWVPGQWRAEVQRLNLHDGTVRQITHGGRALAPVESPQEGLWALQNDGAFNQWAVVRPDGSVRPITTCDRTRFEALAPSPDGAVVAVLVNLDGKQRLYRAALREDGPPRLMPWLGFEQAAIYDVSWGPTGRYLLFAADPDGVANVYAFDTQEGHVVQLANVPFGALEPTLSPDGQTLAFVNYRHERFDLVRVPFHPEARPRVGEARLLRPGEGGWNALTDAAALEPPRRTSHQETIPYRSVRYLRPRIVYPTFSYDLEDEGDPLGVKIGLGVAGADPLRRWAYSGEGFYRTRRLWGEVGIQSGAYLLRPSLSLYDRPYAAGGTGVEERGVELRVGAPATFDANAYLTQAQVQVGSALRQTRIIDGEGAARSDFRTRWTLRPAAAFGYRLQSNPRDLIPNHGLVLRSRAEVDAWVQGRAASRGWLSTVRAYLPWLRTTNTGLTAYAHFLTQSRGAVFKVDRIIPRGYSSRLGTVLMGSDRDWRLGAGNFVQLGTEVVQPVTFIDDGFTLLPLYLKAIYAYGFAETLRPIDGAGPVLSTVGAGMGVQLRFFYTLNLDLRIGAAYRFSGQDVRLVYQ